MSVADAYFDKLYQASQITWSFRERWYEQRKRNLTLAALPRSHYGSIYEPQCADGELSARLAERCSQLLCSDSSAVAVELASQRLAHRGNVRLQQACLPLQWPTARFDLIIFNELACQFSPDELAQLVSLARASLSDGGTLLACHWRRPVDGCPQTGDQVHAQLDAQLGLPKLMRHEDADMLLEVWATQATSVAQREGLAAL